MAICLTPSHKTRVTPDDLPRLSVGEGFAGAKVTLRGLWDGAEVDAIVDEDGTFEVKGLDCPETYEVKCGWMSCWLEVVEAHMCSLESVLDSEDERQSGPRSVGATEDDAFIARERATAVIESACNRSFIPVVDSEDIWGDAGEWVPLAWCGITEIRGDVCPRSDSGVRLRRPGRTAVSYIHGRGPVPADVSAACARLAASYLVPSAIPDRATGESTDAGFLRFTLAGVDGETGIPEVDAVILRHKRTRAVVL